MGLGTLLTRKRVVDVLDSEDHTLILRVQKLVIVTVMSASCIFYYNSNQAA